LAGSKVYIFLKASAADEVPAKAITSVLPSSNIEMSTSVSWKLTPTTPVGSYQLYKK
jgi:hypothetical protein